MRFCVGEVELGHDAVAHRRRGDGDDAFRGGGVYRVHGEEEVGLDVEEAVWEGKDVGEVFCHGEAVEGLVGLVGVIVSRRGEALLIDMVTGRLLEEEADGEDHVGEVGRPRFFRPPCWVAEAAEAEKGVAAVDFVVVGVEEGGFCCHVERDLLIVPLCCTASAAAFAAVTVVG